MSLVSSSGITKAKLVRLVIGVSVTLIFIYFCFKNIKWVDLLSQLESANPAWILLGLIVFLVGHSIRVYRWQMLLRISGSDVTYKNCFSPYVSSFAINNILPFRIGDFVRLFAYTKELKSSHGVVASSLLVERVLDILMVLSILTLAFYFLNINVGLLFNIGIWGLMLIEIAIVAFLFFPVVTLKPLLFLGKKIAEKFNFKLDRVLLELQNLEESLEKIGGFNQMIRLILVSMIAWSFELMMFYFAAFALPLISNVHGSLLAMSAGTLSTAIPAAPGYVGTFHFFVMKSMELSNNSTESAVAYSVLTHALLWFPITLIGGLYIAFSRKKVF